MDITDTFVTNMLLIANAAMLAAAVIAITRFRKQARRFEKNYFLYQTNLDDALTHVMNAHQATLSIVSELGEGSVFTCTFPTERAQGVNEAES